MQIRVVGAQQSGIGFIEPEPPIDLPVIGKEFQAAPSNSPGIFVVISADSDLSVIKEHNGFAGSGMRIVDQYKLPSSIN
jgi:hypothetical protein